VGVRRVYSILGGCEVSTQRGEVRCKGDVNVDVGSM
jgi:hypothetical protein